MLVVNLFGAPGAGKSTGAAYVFSRLKLRGVNAELITEFAKDMVWEGNDFAFQPVNQLHFFAEQFWRMHRCRDKVDVLVTDSPLALSVAYNKSDILGEDFNRLVMSCFDSFNNINYLLQRDKPYTSVGRRQSEAESDQIYVELVDLLHDRQIDHSIVKGNESTYEWIAAMVCGRLTSPETA